MTIPPRDAGHQHKTLAAEFNEIFHHTRSKRIRKEILKSIHTADSFSGCHFSPEIHMSASSNLRPGVILPLFLERRSPTFSLLKKKKKRTPDYILLILRLFAKGTATFVRF